MFIVYQIKYKFWMYENIFLLRLYYLQHDCYTNDARAYLGIIEICVFINVTLLVYDRVVGCTISNWLYSYWKTNNFWAINM